MNAKAHLATYPERMNVYKGVVQPRGKRHELPWSLELVNMFLSCCQQCRRCILPVGIYVDLRMILSISAATRSGGAHCTSQEPPSLFDDSIVTTVFRNLPGVTSTYSGSSSDPEFVIQQCRVINLCISKMVEMQIDPPRAAISFAKFNTCFF